jgi:hypothetical protein
MIQSADDLHANLKTLSPSRANLQRYGGRGSCHDSFSNFDCENNRMTIGSEMMVRNQSSRQSILIMGFCVIGWLCLDFSNALADEATNGVASVALLGAKKLALLPNLVVLPTSPLLDLDLELRPVNPMSLPSGSQTWEYPAIVSPVRNVEPSSAKPVGVGEIATGGNTIALSISLPSFSGAADVYFGIYSAALDQTNIFLLNSDHTLQPSSVGIVPWKANTTGNVSEAFFGEIPISALPSGTYDFFLAVTPAGSGNWSSYYLWKTSVSIIRMLLPGNITVVEPGFGLVSGTIPPVSLLAGDLDIGWTRAVQVLDIAPLVKRKATGFRVKVRSTFSYTVNVKIKLTLPSDQWSFITGSGYTVARLPGGWQWPEKWGPVPIQPGDNEIMLPYIPPGQESAPVSAANPAGIISGDCTINGCGPDVRVLPVPKADYVSYGLEIDPDNEVAETNEGNNATSTSLIQAQGMYGWNFLFVPTNYLGDPGPARLDRMEATAKASIEYLLGTFPIGDMNIKYQIMPAATSGACPDIPGDTCGYSINWPAGESRSDFFTRLKQMADSKGYSYDFIVAVSRGGGGGTGGHNDAAFIGDESGMGILAHEFNHAVTGMGDIYSQDCLVGWDEAYCEHSDGSREYCCNMSIPQVSQGPYCFNGSYGETICDDTPVAKDCAETCSDWASCNTECLSICGDGTVYHGPDCRVRHPSSKGVWANRWVQIDSKMNYFMDCNWPAAASFPHYWMILGSTTQHCNKTAFQDGYFNLLKNSRFKAP